MMIFFYGTYSMEACQDGRICELTGISDIVFCEHYESVQNMNSLHERLTHLSVASIIKQSNFTVLRE